MSQKSEEQARRTRLRWVNLGEAIAIAALVISGLGLWHEWRKDEVPSTTTVVEKRQSIPLTLHATPRNDGRTLVIAPVEQSHALESLTLILAGSPPIQVGSDGELESDQVRSALGNPAKDSKAPQSAPVRIDARYVEAGADKHATGNYRLTYRWEGGGLFGGRSIRLTGLTRA